MSYNPEYVQTTVNAEIATLTDAPIGIHLIREVEGVNVFALLYGDDDTPYFVEDTGHRFYIHRELGPRHYANVGEAVSFHRLAEELVETINYALAEGIIEGEEV